MEKTLTQDCEHWDQIKLHPHIMMDALAKHLLGLSSYGMTDAGEIMETYCHLKDSSEETWITQWADIAERLTTQAEEKERSGYSVSAQNLYLRASTYWRISLMCYSNPSDSRVEDYCHRSHTCYEKYLKLSGYPGRYIEIPYEDTFLPGHFYRSPHADEKAPLMILIPGRDTWAEDTRWIYDGLLKRGIHCLIFDGPGQGYALRLNKLPFRYDWENVMTPVIDYALQSFPEVNEKRIGALGISFGGFLLPRACAFEKRIKVCVTDPGNLNWGGHFADIFAKASKVPAAMRPAALTNMMKDYAWKHGVSTDEIIDELRRYDYSDIVDRVTCDTLVLDGTAEINKGASEQFYQALSNCPKEYKLFDETSTAQCHSQMGGYGIASVFICDWICDHLRRA